MLYLALPDDRLFEDFPTGSKFSVSDGEVVGGLRSHDPGRAPLSVSLDIAPAGETQLCLLVMNTGPRPGRVIVRYEGITQEFLVNWQTWGWAPISLGKQYDATRTVQFEIAAADPGSALRIAKVYLRYQNLKHTD